MENTLDEITKTPTAPGIPNPLVDRINQLHENRHWILLSIVLCLMAGFMYLRYSTPRYEITSSLLVKDDLKGTDLGETAMLENLGLSAGKSNVDNEVELLKSYTLMQKVAYDLALYVSYFAKGNIKTTALFEASPVTLQFISPPVLKGKARPKTYFLTILNHISYVISDDEHTWKLSFGDTLSLPEGKAILNKTGFISTTNGSYLISISSMQETVKRYREALHVSATNKQVSIITLKLSDILPRRGEAVLTQLIENYLQASITDKNSITDSTIAFIDENLSLVSQELTGLEKQIEQYRTSNGIADLSEQSRLLLENNSTNEKERDYLNIQLSIISALLSFVETNPSGIVPASIAMQHPAFLSGITQYNDLQIQRNRSMSTSTVDHPEVQNVDRQLEIFRNALIEQIQTHQKELKIKQSALFKGIQGTTAQISKIPNTERRFLDYTRQQQIRQELYVFLLKKRVETAISKSSIQPSGHIIDQARADDLPISPNRSITLLTSFLIGVFLPIAVINMRDTFNTRITDKKELPHCAPLIAQISQHKRADGALFDPENSGHVSEQFRTLRTNLQFLSAVNNDKIILLTSTMAGEGKTFIGVNLCKALQLAGKKVILVEADLRKHHVDSPFELPGPGLSEFIISGLPVSEIIQHGGSWYSFDVITSGISPTNPGELVLSERIPALLSNLSLQYDYIVLDSAPFGTATDARILGQYAHISLCILRQNFTFRNQLEGIQEIAKNQLLPKFHLVLNHVKPMPLFG